MNKENSYICSHRPHSPDDSRGKIEPVMVLPFTTKIYLNSSPFFVVNRRRTTCAALYCLLYLFPAQLEDLVGAGFIASAIFFAGGIIALSIRPRAKNAYYEPVNTFDSSK